MKVGATRAEVGMEIVACFPRDAMRGCSRLVEIRVGLLLLTSSVAFGLKLVPFTCYDHRSIISESCLGKSLKLTFNVRTRSAAPGSGLVTDIRPRKKVLTR